MGYSVFTNGHDLRTKPDVTDATILTALRATFTDPYRYITDVMQRAADVGDVLAMIGFEVQQTPCDGSAWWLSYGEKAGDEALLFEALAPFLAPGSYLNWVGEAGEHWQWYFDGEQLQHRAGRIVYDTLPQEG